MDGQVIRQSTSYRHGLVLGLTMAEIMLLLIFCLLIAMASFLHAEQTKRVAVEMELKAAQARELRDATGTVGSPQEMIAGLQSALRQQNEVIDNLRNGQGGVRDENWRELVEIVTQLKNGGLSSKDIRDRVATGSALQSKGIDIDKAIRDGAIVDAIGQVMSGVREPTVSPKDVADAVARGLTGIGPAGHQWPPIIRLSEADGYYFRSGSADLSPEFRKDLVSNTPDKIAEIIRKYKVDVIEVVGHTDEQPLGVHQSNLDHGLVSVLKNSSGVATLTPADNAGLAMARAVSVVSVLLQSKKLEGYKIIPLSGAQLVNNDETLALLGTPGDVRERRRIEIRLRKSTPQEARIRIAPAEIDVPRPAPRPPIRRQPQPQSPPLPVAPARPLDLYPNNHGIR